MGCKNLARGRTLLLRHGPGSYTTSWKTSRHDKSWSCRRGIPVRQRVAGFFESLADSTVIPDKIVVVENSPSLPTSIPTLPGLPITVLHRPDNPGYGASANHGVAELAKVPDLIVICNPDIVWQPQTLETLITEMESRPTVGIAGPRLLNTDGSTYPSARAFPGSA